MYIFGLFFRYCSGVAHISFSSSHFTYMTRP